MYSQFHSDYRPSQAESPTPVTHDTHQPHGTDLIGRPILFVSGQFAGQTIRAELREVQQAKLGRKYAKVDRRPLDPPPVVHLRLFQVFDADTDSGVEKEVQDYEDVQALGLVCTVDLFLVSSAATSSHQQAESSQKSQGSPSAVRTTFASSSTAQFTSEPSREQTYTFVPPHTYPTSQSFDNALTPSPTRSTPTSIPEYVPQPHTDALHYVNGFPILESSKKTSSLVGATFVQPAIVEYQGKKSIMFVFADLAVKAEGTFILRYRVFDIFSRPYNYSDLVVQAECYGGPFRVYSTKEFPGLQASTELTKHLARWGVRLNTREAERKRRKKGEARSVSPLYSPRKRKLPSPTGAGTSYESDDE